MPSAARCQPLPEPWVFFLDRSLGGRIVFEGLRDQGEAVEAHDRHFAQDASDVEWLGAVGRKGWVVLSKDDRIRLNEVERAALVEAGVAAFFLSRRDLTGPQMADSFVKALPAIKRVLRRFPVPFIARISAQGEVSVFESAGNRFTPPKHIRP
jgi:PIN like domain